MISYDAIVVGAGPTGSATARDLARGGLRVLLLEEHPQIGLPLHCSGLVTPRALALAQMSNDVVRQHITGAFIHSPSQRRLAIGGDRLRAVVMDRVLFDERMAEQAQTAGAELLLGHRFVGAERQAGYLNVYGRDGAGDIRLRTRLLIGADGVRSRVARWLGLPRPPEVIRGLGVVARLKVERQDFVEVFVGTRVAPGWFGWIIPLEGDHVRIGIGTANGQSPIHYLREMVGSFPGRFAGMEVESFSGGSIPIAVRGPSYADNVMLVGDAAGQVKPTSGGGIYTGLIGAKHCAQTAAAALARGDVSAASLSRYERAWQREIGPELARGRDLRRIFVSLQDSDLDQLLGVLENPSLQRLITRYGDIDFPSALFARLAYAAPTLVRLFLRRPLLLPSLWLRLALQPPAWQRGRQPPPREGNTTVR